MDKEKYLVELINHLDFDLDTAKDDVGGVAKKLNQVYYSSDSVSDHLYIVGSVGRGTAIYGCSDIDIIFGMPEDKFDQYDAYADNGQSALLQEVKNILTERYPQTTIRGDGQVVVVEFNKRTVEIVPGFKTSDGSFMYPDTHNGGGWKITNPIAEQEECAKCDSISGHVYFDLCKLIRAWKNNAGFVFHGILIDTLVYNFLESNGGLSIADNDHFRLLVDVVGCIAEKLDSCTIYYAPGSNDEVLVDAIEAEKIAGEAKKTAKLLSESEDKVLALKEVLGPVGSLKNANLTKCSYNNTEEFIKDKFPVDVMYSLDIDGTVTLAKGGFRPFSIANTGLSLDKPIKIGGEISFAIKHTSCPQPYDVYWKVRNVGKIAEARNEIRGQIFKGRRNHREKAKFYGPHFVECYIVKNGVCVARSKLDVPIG